MTIVIMLGVLAVFLIVYSFISFDKEFNGLVEQYEEEKKIEWEEELLWCSAKELADYCGENISRVVCACHWLNHNGMAEKKIGQNNEGKPITVFKSTEKNINIRDLVKYRIEEVQEKKKIQKVKITNENNSPFIPLVCPCCGGKINKNNLTCTFCGTEFIMGG